MKELLSRENSRTKIYKFLSGCYYLPDEELIKTLGRVEKSRGGLYSEIAKHISGMDEIAPIGEKLSNEVELLKIDYSKLFVGPYKPLAPPYGSVYLEDERRVMGDSTMDVRNWYRKERLDIALKEAPDHIAVELEFMYFLIFKEIEAIKSSDDHKALNYLRKQMSFLQTHLGRWINEFAENVVANAKSEFYKTLARLTKSFVEKDLNNLDVFMSHHMPHKSSSHIILYSDPDVSKLPDTLWR